MKRSSYSSLILHRGDNTLGHYDKRYFHGVVSDEERGDTQQHMVRAYLNFFRENDLDTWIAHGTLLGWWWNGQVGRPSGLGSAHTDNCSDYLGTLISTHKSAAQLYITSAKFTTRQTTTTLPMMGK